MRKKSSPASRRAFSIAPLSAFFQSVHDLYAF